MRSIHALIRTPLTTAAPIGDVIERDSRGIGAVEINGTEPVVVIARNIAPRERTAVWLVALATALLWDPAQA